MVLPMKFVSSTSTNRRRCTVVADAGAIVSEPVTTTFRSVSSDTELVASNVSAPAMFAPAIRTSRSSVTLVRPRS
jgi:hypothetical protein